jgi:shikimate dehydrogenase
MGNNFRMKSTGAFGYPIDENPSGVMVEAGYGALGLNWRYQLFEVRREDLPEAIAGIRGMHFEGVNLTIPHKIAAIQYMDDLSDSAKTIGAINTVINRSGRLIGENTDGKGFIIGMNQNNVSLKGKRIALLGAGGAARAISVECAFAGCASIAIIARNERAGTQLRDLIISATSCKATYHLWTSGVHIPPCDILINATNVGLYPDNNRPDICYEDIYKGMIVQDIIPNPAVTPFLIEAQLRGAITFDGMQMLVHQGALAIELWTGKKPSTDVMLKALRRYF